MSSFLTSASVPHSSSSNAQRIILANSSSIVRFCAQCDCYSLCARVCVCVSARKKREITFQVLRFSWPSASFSLSLLPLPFSCARYVQTELLHAAANRSILLLGLLRPGQGSPGESVSVCICLCVCVSVCAEQRKVAKGQRQASLTSSHLISFICLSRSEASAARPHCWLKVFGHGQIQLQQLSRSGLKSRLKTLHNLAVAATAVACVI